MVEYGFMVQTMDIKPDMEDSTADQLSQGMAVALNKMAQGASKGLSNLPGGGGNPEIISHNLTRIGGHLLVTFMFKR
jgi:hypothetical protein